MNIGIWMDGENDDDISSIEDSQHRIHNAQNASAKILAPVASNQNNSTISVLGFQIVPPRGQPRIGIGNYFRRQQCIDHGVTGDVDTMLWHGFVPKRPRGALGRREMLISYRSNNFSISLFRPWCVHVPA